MTPTSLPSVTKSALLAALGVVMIFTSPLNAANAFPSQNIAAGTVLGFADQGQEAQTLMAASGE